MNILDPAFHDFDEDRTEMSLEDNQIWATYDDDDDDDCMPRFYAFVQKHRSPVFDDVLQGRTPEVNYTINDNNYSMGYYLTDGIYLEWATFVKTIPRPQSEKRKLFSKYQESQRKDVERAFGVLQSHFAIVRGTACFWDKGDLGRIMRAFIIIYNMIVEDERDTYATQFDPLPIYDDATNYLSQPDLGEEPFLPYETYIQNTIQMRDKRAHRQLRNDLVDHISQFHNNC
ncbi:uncharacterized protein LOC141691957 [Apium graveolens]|uniref:uncharacterized protein LOC141691957 n=1 Tax=Apium graveolens TaxID=4045 RepID=UPI003D79DA9A